jgi:hypothetical protein
MRNPARRPATRTGAVFHFPRRRRTTRLNEHRLPASRATNIRREAMNSNLHPPANILHYSANI